MSSNPRFSSQQPRHHRLPSLTPSDGDFPSSSPHLPVLPERTPEDEPFSIPIGPVGLGVSPGGGQSAVQLVPRGLNMGEDEKDDLSGEEEDDAGTIRAPQRRKHGHAKSSSKGSSPKKWKGKARAVEADLENGDAVGAGGMGVGAGVVGGTEYAPVESVSPTASYPPVSDEAVEERKVAENLKRWEEQERLRRKAARDRRSHVSAENSSGGSLVEVTRRASLLWRTGGKRRPAGQGGAGDRTSLQSSASDAPLRPLSTTLPREGGEAELGILREPTTPSTAGSGTTRTPADPFSPGGSPQSVKHPPSLSSTKKTHGGHGRPKHTSSISSAFADAKSSDDSEDPFSSRSSLELQQKQPGGKDLPTLPGMAGGGRGGGVEMEMEVALQDAHWQPQLQREISASDGAGSSLEGHTYSGVRHPPEDGSGGEGEGGRGGRARKWWWMDWCCGCGGEETDDEDQAGRTNPFE